MFQVTFERRVELYRTADILEIHQQGYLLGDKLIFSGKMPQHFTKPFYGALLVGYFDEAVWIVHNNCASQPTVHEKPSLRGSHYDLAGVMEALWLGTHYPQAIPINQGLIAPASLVCLDGADWFCPRLIRYIRQVSPSVKALARQGDKLFVPRATSMLLLAH